MLEAKAKANKASLIAFTYNLKQMWNAQSQEIEFRAICLSVSGRILDSGWEKFQG